MSMPGALTRLAATSGLRDCRLGGPLSIALGAVRTKKWRPFHNMYRANKLKEIRAKAREVEAARQAAAAEASGAAGQAAAAGEAAKGDEPHPRTTPFQATRLMRAFDAFRERGATVRFWARLNVDLTRESVRGTCHLPHGLDKKVRVLAFCPDDEIQEMIGVGADVAGISEPVRRIQAGWLEFDRCLATPAVMPQVLKIAKILGPRQLMPNPKSGTVVTNLKQAIKDAKGGTLLEFRAEGRGEVRVTLADSAFPDAKILDNLKFFVQTLLRARPRGGAASAAQAAAPMIQGAPQAPSGPVEGADAKDQYFKEAGLQLGTSGPMIPLDPESMMPASVGYYR